MTLLVSTPGYMGSDSVCFAHFSVIGSVVATERWGNLWHGVG